MGEHAPTTGPTTTPVPSHEQSDVGFRPLAIFLAGLTAMIVVVAFIVAMMFQGFERATSGRDASPPSRSASQRPGVMEPLLQVSSRADMDALRRRENEWLGSAAWIDEPNGMVRMPIESAMELAAERGFPDWPKAEVTPPAPETSEGGVP
jgi:hypothetical protein